jgi:tRNA-dihydrouridine synthase
MGQRSTAEIRSSIEANREDLAVSLVRLRGEVTHLTDWRGHIERHQRELRIGGAVVAGLVIGRRLLRRRNRRG